ncbi:TolC family protein [Sphingobacterium daejeonense]|uniref:TolC family protein n=1 Tax=Sphingobacterium daejeonense TaxID=371142 RepID=UPI0010C49A55|nr:TolC family protein [Sphingobacterium daejeonense]VTP99842.1 Outer membrane efflux protein [Sphingobacterium daejeonense]
MKHIFRIISVLIISINYANGQSLSIKELWTQIDKAANIQGKKLNVDLQKEQLKVRNSERLPVIYGDINLQRNLIIPTTPVPAIAFDPNAPEGAILPLKFSTKWNSKAGVQLEWDLFNPTRKNNIEEDRIALEKSIVEESIERENWKTNATLAYSSIVLATEQYKASLLDSTLYAEINAVNKERFEAGRGKSEDYILSQQELERKRIRIHEAWEVLENANLELNRYYSLDTIAVITSNIEDIVAELEDIDNNDYEQQLIKLDQTLSQVQLSGLKRQLLPTISFNAYFGSQFFSNEFNIIDKSNWYGYSYASLGLKIPISAYFSSIPSLKKAKLNEEIFNTQLDDQTLQDKIDGQQKSNKIKSAKEKIERLKRILVLSEQNKDEKLAMYQNGRILLNEFNLANSDYIKAQQDIWQAKYDLINIILE